MRWTETFIPTLKEDPADAEIPSHRLMLRAGLIRKLSAGTYTYLPLGLRSLRKVSQIIRQEMNRTGAIEIMMPILQPAELWKQSGRYETFGEDLILFSDRHNRENVLSPTHEEVITDLVRNHIHSYRQLPVTFYQIQPKFRDEVRPRFGVLRSREFLMKDAYSFDADESGLDESYRKMYEAYCRIFERCGLKYLVVEAEPGAMGGDVSHEFMVPCDSGEDLLVLCEACDYAANLERAESSLTESGPEEPLEPMKVVETPGMKTIEQVSRFLNVEPRRLVKSLVYRADGGVVLALVRGDHDINETKLKKFLGAVHLQMADEATIEKLTGAPVGFTGPVGIKAKIIADEAVAKMKNFVTGANRDNAHLLGVNPGRDFKIDAVARIRFAREGDRCPRCTGRLKVSRGIEIGHLFKLGLKYSKAMSANYLDEKGRTHPIVMGCYGIGVNRIVASAIEMLFDKDGIVWPLPIAPYEVLVLPLDMGKKDIVETSEKIYAALEAEGIDVLLDDRNLRPGVKFKDADLIGIPFRLTVGEKALAKGMVELKRRSEREVRLIPAGEAAKAAAEAVEAERRAFMKKADASG